MAINGNNNNNFLIKIAWSGNYERKLSLQINYFADFFINSSNL